MFKSAKVRIFPLIISLAIALGTGALSGFVTMDAMKKFEAVKQPPLSPPPEVFPVVWTILFILMGISAYLIYVSDKEGRCFALTLYGVQLVLNFLWPIFFFNLEMYLFAFIWLIILWLTVLAMIVVFGSISKTAALLQIPYILWLTFAAYLNMGVFLLNG